MRRLLVVLMLASLAAAGLPTAAAAPPERAPRWLVRGTDPGRVLAAVAAHPAKLSTDYVQNLRHVQPDGTLRVMVALARRNQAVEAFVNGVVKDLHWYGDGPRFYASVDQRGFAALLESEVVTFVEPDYPLTYHLATSVIDVNTRGSAGFWDFQPVGTMGTLSSVVPELSLDAATGKGVTVAVIDSGIDKTHRDFGGWNCQAGPYQPCDSRIVKAMALDHVLKTGFDVGDLLPTTDFASGHGTHVAGIIAGNGYYARDGEANPSIFGGDGNPIGMAPQASLVSVKLGDGLSAALSQVALQWTLDHVEDYDIRVTNNSWGCLGGCSYQWNSVLSHILKDLYDEGVVNVFAAGNEGGDGGGGQLSGFSQSPYVLSVASYDHLTGELSSFSSRGLAGSPLADPATWTPQSEGTLPPRRPDLGAPGDRIYAAANLTGGAASLVPRVDPADLNQEPGVYAYTFMGGTSMSAPHVAGAAALLISACPRARPLDVMRGLMAGATPDKVRKTGSNAIAEPFEVGYGALNVRAGLEWMLARPPCNGTGVGSIEGTVGGGDPKQAIEGAEVTCADDKTAISDAAGIFMIEDVVAETYLCTARAKGFKAADRDVTVEHASTKEVDFILTKKKSKKKRRS